MLGTESVHLFRREGKFAQIVLQGEFENGDLPKFQSVAYEAPSARTIGRAIVRIGNG